MLRRLSLFAVVGLLAMVVLAACGDDDEGEEPTATRIPATDAPATTAPTTEAGTGAASPAASPSAGSVATPAASPVATDASPEAPAASPAASPEATPDLPAGTPSTGFEVTVDLLDIRFEPTEVTIPANTDVVVHLVNKGVTIHTFDIDQFNVHSGEMAANESMDVTINAPAGEYEFYCAVPGHKEAGMVGKLIVQ